MIQQNFDDLKAFYKKATLSPEEQKVVDAIVGLGIAEGESPATPAVTEAKDVLEDAQEALVATPSTTV